MLMAIQKAKTADRERELERIVDDWLDKTRDEREEKLAEETTEEQKMKGSIIDDTTAIGKRLNELTSRQVAVAKTAAPPPRRLSVCLRCDDTGWTKDGRNWRTCSACSNPLRKPLPDKVVDF